MKIRNRICAVLCASGFGLFCLVVSQPAYSEEEIVITKAELLYQVDIREVAMLEPSPTIVDDILGHSFQYKTQFIDMTKLAQDRFDVERIRNLRRN